MNKIIQNCIGKKKWTKPHLILLSIKETNAGNEGGGNDFVFPGSSAS